MRLELRQLRYFVAVAEEKNFTRAARRVFVTQPALSHQIRRLEEDLGVKLLERSSRHVELTEAGRDLLALARQTLTGLERGVEELRRKAGVGRTVLRVALTEYGNYGPLPEAIRRFAERHPDVRLEQIEANTLAQQAELRAGRLDVGFYLETSRDPDLSSEVLWREPLVLALPATHRLARLERIPFRLLDGEPLILNSRRHAPGMHDYILRLCREAGARPRVRENEGPQIYTFGGVARLVAEGAGLFPIVATLARVGFPGVAFRPLCDPEPSLPIVAAWRRDDPSPLVRGLVEAVTAGSIPSAAR